MPHLNSSGTCRKGRSSTRNSSSKRGEIVRVKCPSIELSAFQGQRQKIIETKCMDGESNLVDVARLLESFFKQNFLNVLPKCAACTVFMTINQGCFKDTFPTFPFSTVRFQGILHKYPIRISDYSPVCKECSKCVKRKY